jgi:hypothetical protein
MSDDAAVRPRCWTRSGPARQIVRGAFALIAGTGVSFFLCLSNATVLWPKTFAGKRNKMAETNKGETPKPNRDKPHPSEVRYVFLDTQVFEKNQYDLHSKDFQKLVSLVRLGKIKLVTTDVTMREINSHLAQRVVQAETLLKKFQRELLPLKRTKNKLLAPLLREYRSKDFFASLEAEVKHFFDRCNVEVIPISEHDLQDVLDLHFAKKPPFNNPKKKGEFPDAFVMLALKEWSHSFFKQTVHVVSGDSDWKAICQTVEEFKHWDLLPELLTVFPDAKLASAIERGFEEHKKFVCDMIGIKFQNLNFYLDQASGEISNIQVKQVRIERVFVVEADTNNKGRIDVECHVSFSCDAKYDASTPGYHDPRERCNVYPEQRWVQYEGGEFFMVEIDISWNPKKPSEITVQDQRFKTCDVFVDLKDILGSDN